MVIDPMVPILNMFYDNIDKYIFYKWTSLQNLPNQTPNLGYIFNFKWYMII